MPSRRDHFPETLARVGRSCRKLSMSGSCGWSLAIWCETKTRASPKRQGGARRVCALTRRVAREEWSVVSEAEARELAVREKRQNEANGDRPQNAWPQRVNVRRIRTSL